MSEHAITDNALALCRALNIVDTTDRATVATTLAQVHNAAIGLALSELSFKLKGLTPEQLSLLAERSEKITGHLVAGAK